MLLIFCLEQRKNRLARSYLTQLEDAAAEGEPSEDDEGLITGSYNVVPTGAAAALTAKLEKERMKAVGVYFESISGTYKDYQPPADSIKRYNGHQSSLTCVCISPDDRYAYSGSKDNSVMQTDLVTGRYTALRPRWTRSTSDDKQSHEGEVLAVACSSDGKILAVAGRDKMVRLIDLKTMKEVKSMGGHRDAVTCLAFRRDSSMLMSGSLDRAVKHWDIKEQSYVETLYGHQMPIFDIDMIHRERCITASEDRTLRLWKIVEDSHLKYLGDESSLERVKLLTEETFVSGSQSGTLALWSATKKKPTARVKVAHGYEGDDKESSTSSTGAGGASSSSRGAPRWITALATIRMSDVVASGSFDGYVRLWRASGDGKQLERLTEFEVVS